MLQVQKSLNVVATSCSSFPGLQDKYFNDCKTADTECFKKSRMRNVHASGSPVVHVMDTDLRFYW